MAYVTEKAIQDEGNQLSPGVAGAAMVPGTPVYLDSAGAWQKAQAVCWARLIPAEVVRKDVVGICIDHVNAGSEFTPVRECQVSGYSSLTIGGAVYVSTTAGSVTQTKPYPVCVVQKIGVAIAADVVEFSVSDNAIASLGNPGASAVIFSGTSGEAIKAGDLCGLSSTLLVKLADATAASSLLAVGFCKNAIATGTAGASLMNMGTVSVSAVSVAGMPIYLYTTGGSYSATAPSSTGQIIQTVGQAITTTRVLVNVNNQDATTSA